jgi:hypothetical protein
MDTSAGTFPKPLVFSEQPAWPSCATLPTPLLSLVLDHADSATLLAFSSASRFLYAQCAQRWESAFAREKRSSSVWRCLDVWSWKARFYAAVPEDDVQQAVAAMTTGDVVLLLPGVHRVHRLDVRDGGTIRGVAYNMAVIPSLIQQSRGARSLDAVLLPGAPNVTIETEWPVRWWASGGTISNLAIHCKPRLRQPGVLLGRGANLCMSGVTVVCDSVSAVWCDPGSSLLASGCAFRSTVLAHGVSVMSGAKATLNHSMLMQSGKAFERDNAATEFPK